MIPIASIDFSDKSLYNEIYIPLLKNKKRYIFMKWGAWSGKSTFQAQKEIIKTYTPGNRLLAMRKVKDTIKESVFAELVWMIEAWGLEAHFQITKSPMYIKNIITWSDVVFRWMDNPEKIKSIRRVSRVWLEEATEFHKRDIEQLDLRLRWQAEMQITCTFNPIDEMHWLNTDFWSMWITEHVELLHSTYKNNKWAWPEYDQVMERLKITNPNMYNIYALWLWGAGLEWVIFKFDDIQEIPTEANLLWYGKDFWYTNDPTTLTAVYEWNGKIILDEVIYRTGLVNVYLKEEDRLRSIVWLYEENWISKQKEIWSDSAEPKSIEEIHRYWYNIKPVVKWADSISFGISIMQQYEILITSRSWNIKKEFRNYTWAVDKNGKLLNEPIDAFNHAIDGTRYFFMMRLSKSYKKKLVSAW